MPPARADMNKDIAVRIGAISGAHGVKGEIKLFHDSGEPDRLKGLKELIIRKAETDTEKVYGIQGFRMQGRIPVFKLSGIDDRAGAEALRGSDVFVCFSQLPPLDEGQYYVSDLIGMDVADSAGFPIGTVKDILPNPAHDILEIALPGGEWIMLPMADSFVLSIDTDSRRLTVSLPEGLETYGGKK